MWSASVEPNWWSARVQKRRSSSLEITSILRTIVMQFKALNILFTLVALSVSSSSASIITERSTCSSLYVPCSSDASCCHGQTCYQAPNAKYGVSTFSDTRRLLMLVSSLVQSCTIDPNVCGASGDQCNQYAPENTCCDGLTCVPSSGLGVSWHLPSFLNINLIYDFRRSAHEERRFDN